MEFFGCFKLSWLQKVEVRGISRAAALQPGLAGSLELAESARCRCRCRSLPLPELAESAQPFPWLQSR